MKKYIIVLGAVCASFMMGCQDSTELEGRIEALEKKVDQLFEKGGSLYKS